MANLWHDLETGPDVPNVVNAVVECPAGSRNKYEYDKDVPGMVLDRVLNSSVHYPGDYAFLPQTYYDDGDPFDIIVLVDDPTFPGCVVEARPVALLHMTDDAGRDNKVIAVPADDPRYDDVQDVDDVADARLAEIEEFFATYKNLEDGKHAETDGFGDREAAREDIEHAVDLYDEKFA